MQNIKNNFSYYYYIRNNIYINRYSQSVFKKYIWLTQAHNNNK